MRIVRILVSSGALVGALLISGVSSADIPSSGGGGAGGGATTATTASGTGGGGGGSADGGGSSSSTTDDSGCAVSKPGDSVAAGTMTALAVLALAIAGGSRRRNKKSD